jgi:hypothetical protein
VINLFLALSRDPSASDHKYFQAAFLVCSVSVSSFKTRTSEFGKSYVCVYLLLRGVGCERVSKRGLAPLLHDLRETVSCEKEIAMLRFEKSDELHLLM